MKFISFAILSALASFTVAAPAPKQDHCVPEQGDKYDYSYDMTGSYTFNDCALTSLQFESGVFKAKSAYNFVQAGPAYTFCSKSHGHIADGKAVDSEGNRYNVMQMNGGQDEGTSDYSVPSYDYDQKYQSKYKFVGQGKLANSVWTFSYKCHYSYDPTEGYKQDCKKNDWSFKCSA